MMVGFRGGVWCFKKCMFSHKLNLRNSYKLATFLPICRIVKFPYEIRLDFDSIPIKLYLMLTQYFTQTNTIKLITKVTDIITLTYCNNKGICLHMAKSLNCQHNSIHSLCCVNSSRHGAKKLM